MDKKILNKFILPEKLLDILETVPEVIIPNSREQLLELSLGRTASSTFDVCFEVNDNKIIREASVIKCKNGIVANFDDIYMRRRDPDSMVIADDLPTDKTTHTERFGIPFDGIRDETFEWLKGRDSIILMPFMSGYEGLNLGYPSLLILPTNSAFFALSLADLQGFLTQGQVTEDFKPRAIVYVAPPFRHTHYDGKQVVIHNRSKELHEVFSYNLYPGPSAKKGIYAVLLDIGEQEGWTTLHASSVKVITPYELSLNIMHEGASGGGKSEMLEPFHREPDGRLRLGINTVTGEEYLLSIADSLELHPITDDMAMCHSSLQKQSGKLVITDAEAGWFQRVDQIKKYGTEPTIEKNTIHPKEPLVFFNMDAIPESTCLIWEHIHDTPEKTCPNPRIIMPRKFVENVINESAEIDVRSFGLRTPPCTKDRPSYGIVGMFHVLPPALAWLWRLVAPRGYANPSINDKSKNDFEMKSEGVGSFWPFSTGRKVDQANLLLRQILRTPLTRYILIPNQYIGAYAVGFAGQWATREYISRRGGVKFREEVLTASRCPLLGFALNTMKIDGVHIRQRFLQVNLQSEVGEAGYDAGATILTDFFKTELESYLVKDLHPLGKLIIEACLYEATPQEYLELTPNGGAGFFA